MMAKLENNSSNNIYQTDILGDGLIQEKSVLSLSF